MSVEIFVAWILQRERARDTNSLRGPGHPVGLHSKHKKCPGQMEKNIYLIFSIHWAIL